jgi:hypothetical protein
MVGKHFKDALMAALLKAEPAVLKVLIEAVSITYLIFIAFLLFYFLF